jgi:SAM-dependent methyltransferase
VGVQERLSLDAISANTLIASEHVHRYALAARLCAGMRVVDLACGSGYGSAILSETATAVTGIDVDKATVDVARATVGRDNDVAFEAADALEFLGRELNGDYDAIVCFEGLEHFPDPESVLGRLEHQATEGMKVIISVPNSKGFEEENQFHVTDYGYEQARDAFGRFDEVTLLYQFLAEGSLIRHESPSELEPEFVLGEHGEPEWANHFIACVNFEAQLGEIGDAARMQLAVAPLYNRHMRALERANRELFRENGRLGRERIGIADSAAITMSERVAVLQQRITYLESLLGSPRHRAIERARDRLSRVPALDRAARSLGAWLSRN